MSDFAFDIYTTFMYHFGYVRFYDQHTKEMKRRVYLFLQNIFYCLQNSCQQIYMLWLEMHVSKTLTILYNSSNIWHLLFWKSCEVRHNNVWSLYTGIQPVKNANVDYVWDTCFETIQMCTIILICIIWFHELLVVWLP